MEGGGDGEGGWRVCRPGKVRLCDLCRPVASSYSIWEINERDDFSLALSGSVVSEERERIKRTKKIEFAYSMVIGKCTNREDRVYLQGR